MLMSVVEKRKTGEHLAAKVVSSHLRIVCEGADFTGFPPPSLVSQRLNCNGQFRKKQLNIKNTLCFTGSPSSFTSSGAKVSGI